jgi:chromosome segregation ATPase
MRNKRRTTSRGTLAIAALLAIIAGAVISQAAVAATADTYVELNNFFKQLQYYYPNIVRKYARDMNRIADLIKADSNRIANLKNALEKEHSYSTNLRQQLETQRDDLDSIRNRNQHIFELRKQNENLSQQLARASEIESQLRTAMQRLKGQEAKAGRDFRQQLALSQSQDNDLQHQLSAVRQQGAEAANIERDLRRKLARSETHANELQDQLSAAKRQVEEAANTKDNLRQELKRQEGSIEQLNTKLAKAKSGGSDSIWLLGLATTAVLGFFAGSRRKNRPPEPPHFLSFHTEGLSRVATNVSEVPRALNRITIRRGGTGVRVTTDLPQET